MSKTEYPYYIPLSWENGQMVKLYTSKKFSTFKEAKKAAYDYIQNPWLAKRVNQMFVAKYTKPYISTLVEI